MTVRMMWCPQCEVLWCTRDGSNLFCWICSEPGHVDTSRFTFLVTVPVVASQGPIVAPTTRSGVERRPA